MLTSVPLTQAFSITPSDAVDLPIYTRAISVNVTGNLVVNLTGDPNTDITFNAQAGVLYYIQVKRVKTASAATGILGWI